MLGRNGKKMFMFRFLDKIGAHMELSHCTSEFKVQQLCTIPEIDLSTLIFALILEPCAYTNLGASGEAGDGRCY